MRTASVAQINAARDAWPLEMPPPSDDELRVLVEAVLAAEWPDGAVREGPQ
jgi:hypothetical protein